MGSHKTTISINGKKYDARSGQLLDSAHPPSEHKKVMSVDGFIPNPKNAALMGVQADGVRRSVPHKPREHGAHHIPHHSLSKPKTLMRTTVKKPEQRGEHIKAKSSAVDSGTKPSKHASYIESLHDQISRERLRRAKEIDKSKLISRFGDFTSAMQVVRKTKPLPVKPAPIKEVITHHQPAAVIESSFQAQQTSPPGNMDIFTEAIARATSHEQPAPKIKRRGRVGRKLKLHGKAVSVAFSVLIVTMLGGLAIYQFRPNLEVNLASSRSGIKASLPNYIPQGYSYGGIDYTRGSVTVNYNADEDSKKYSVTQTTSNWDSEALYNTEVAGASTSSQTIERGGKTIYLYSGGKATWVDGGVWYQVSGESSLGSDEVLKIVDSL